MLRLNSSVAEPRDCEVSVLRTAGWLPLGGWGSSKAEVASEVYTRCRRLVATETVIRPIAGFCFGWVLGFFVCVNVSQSLGDATLSRRF